MINKILPFLSQYVPAGLAIKGLSKVNPKLGGFIQSSLAYGYTADNILEFLRDKIEPQGIKSERERLQKGASQGTLRPDEMSNLQKLNDQGIGKIPAASIGLAAGSLGALSQNETQQLDQSQTIEQPQKQEPQQASPIEFISGYSPDLAQQIQALIQQGKTPQEAAALFKLPGKYSKIVSQIEKDTKENFVDLISRLFGGMQQQTQQASPQMQQPLQQQGQNANAQLMSMIDKFMQGTKG